MAFLDVTDRLAPSFAVAAIVHRVANLFNSEIVGKAMLGALVVSRVWAVDRRWGHERRPRGGVTGIALLIYFTGRCFVELLKAPQPSETLTGAVNMGQLLSLPLLAAGLLLTWRSLRLHGEGGWRTLREP